MNGDALDPAQLARRTVQVCGFVPTAVVGPAHATLTRQLRALGCTAIDAGDDPAGLGRSLAGVPVRAILAHVAMAPDDAARTALLAACRGTGARTVHLLVRSGSGVAGGNGAATGGTGDGRTGGREDWERAAFEVGYRKHPSHLRVAPYDALDQPGPWLEFLFERLDDAQLARFPLAALHRDRQLHMDMLREVGRRGDAHVVRYARAAEFVRPGDRVLDLACGYGYGSAVLFHDSLAHSVLGIDAEPRAIDYATANYGVEGRVRFEVGDAQALRSVPDHSIDFVATFETIEHLLEPDRYLDELKRVLRPSGRILICAPNDWTDETGKDPNPHHLHVYTWERLLEEVGARFLLEKGFVQTAGGAMKHPHAPRRWIQVPLAPLEHEAEWILLLGMATPLGAEHVPYVETSFPIPLDDPTFHVTAFGRDYDNPWLVKAIVTRGMRLENPVRLRELQDAVLAGADPTSVDHGAALCGQAYALLDAAAPRDQVDAMDQRILAYCNAPRTPHRVRWQISLLYVAGELLLQAGDRERARVRFQACAERDASIYSPLLGNKTLDARFRLALLAVADDDLGGAEEQLLASVEEARRLVRGSWRNITGDPARPLAFGLAETAQLLDRGARAAYALQQLATADLRPGVFAREAAGWFERLLAWRDEDAAATRRGIDALQTRVRDLDAQVARLADELMRKEARTHELAAEVVAQDRIAQDLARQVRELHAHGRAAPQSGGAAAGAAGWFSRLFGRRGK